MKRSDEQRRDVTGIPLREIRICEDGRGRGSKVAFSVHHLNSCPRSQTQLSLLAMLRHPSTYASSGEHLRIHVNLNGCNSQT